MPRRKASFVAGTEPFQDSHDLQLEHSRVTGPFTFLNPTRAQFNHSAFTPSGAAPYPNGTTDTPKLDEEAIPGTKADSPASHVSFLWRSRDNRKGRHAIVVHPPKPDQPARLFTPAKTSSAHEIGKGIWRMFTCYPYWDISWLVAFIFTWGSIVWVINAFFVWLPSVDPSTEFPNEILTGGGITAFIGAIIFFETGSILLIFEAVNENRAGCFGWALEHLIEGDEKQGTKIRIRPSKQACIHHHQNRANFVGRPSSNTCIETKPQNKAAEHGKAWQWFPSWHALRTHYFHELGFLAGLSQFFGATIFGIAGFTALPGIQPITPQRVLNGVYWIPQIVGGSGFIVSGTLYMLETQKNWYTPAFGVLGWWIAFWNLIGGIGFTLSGALGPAYGSYGAQYQAGCATFWGSWAFLVGSVLQLYESLDKHPVEGLSKET